MTIPVPPPKDDGAGAADSATPAAGVPFPPSTHIHRWLQPQEIADVLTGVANNPDPKLEQAVHVK